MNTDNLQSLKDEILSQLDIVDEISKHVTLVKKGQSYVCLCPFHDDSNPSLTINRNKQIFKCFVCQVGGDVIKFVSKFKKISWYDSLKYLANELNLDYDNTLFMTEPSRYSAFDLEVTELNEEVNSFFKINFKKLKNTTLNNFFLSRDLNTDLLNNFDIGYCEARVFTEFFGSKIHEKPLIFAKAGLIHVDTLAPTFDNRVTFAIRDDQGKVVGFSARSLDKDAKPKYINSSESTLFQKNALLYNYWRAKDATHEQKRLIIVEGFFDVIALYKIGKDNVVALMGTSLTNNHLKFLHNKDIILFLDGDQAGQSASLKNAKFLLSKNINVHIVKNQTRLDPDEIIKKYGIEYIQTMLDKAQLATDFIYDYFKHQYNLQPDSSNNLDSISNFVDSFFEYINVCNQNIRNYYIDRIKNEFSFDPAININLSKNTQKHSYNADYTNEFTQSFYTNQAFVEDNYIYQHELPQKPYLASEQKTESLSWIDRLFYAILEHPSLRELFIQRANSNEGKLYLKVFKDYKSEVYDLITQPDCDLEYVKKILAPNDQKRQEFDSYTQDFYRNTEQNYNNLLENFNFAYRNAQNESFRRYAMETATPEFSDRANKLPAVFSDHAINSKNSFNSKNKK
ncbi:DNA primase [Mycoplasmopsis californica HAZ160_1]|uniref:DNA primase n=2 Tax=Mycoplasmopsis californica TaxID=2113 RepID=A0A059XVZ5_9BACT|nr:DNA primase [Mycoplasmopsis californica]AIA29422.1 DNA primase [Mycoplasmopsis californica]BAP01129.1 DNA primase [Mycoplasmopsis californica HAZ160_1]BBG40995.1 DNA primase [Mycoplasmopsis californica]BBG41588.1 DNA primase [Mycoplasmopsis californica]BBG42182.1 DNA primase [Mycoplasmopsis californica]